jgi:hypothetical protein
MNPIRHIKWFTPFLKYVLFCYGLFVLGRVADAQSSTTTNSAQKNAPIVAEMNDAIEKVKAIVNQRVTAYRQAPGMRVSTSTEGWFHEGATKPDFDTVDVRQTQELPYANKPYVTSSLNPGMVFPGNELEFNSMTKYFYTDRTLPKKRLTDVEMQEINRLYRIIGRCEKQLNPVGSISNNADSEATDETKGVPARRIGLRNGIIGIGSLLGFYLLYRAFR